MSLGLTFSKETFESKKSFFSMFYKPEEILDFHIHLVRFVGEIEYGIFIETQRYKFDLKRALHADGIQSFFKTIEEADAALLYIKPFFKKHGWSCDV